MSFQAGTSGPASTAPLRVRGQILQTFESGHWFAHFIQGGKGSLIDIGRLRPGEAV
jgi:hypothetical protein